MCAGGAVSTAGARAQDAAAASAGAALSDAYQDALYAATVEQSLERAYLLGRQPSVLGWQQEAARSVTQALDSVAVLGGPSDRALVDRLRADHAERLRMLAASFAVEPADAATATAAGQRASALSEDIQDALSVAAQASYSRSAAVRARAAEPGLRLELLVAGAVGGALLAVGLCVVIVHGHRRGLRAERSNTRHLQAHDLLTGLPNRAVLHDRLAQSLLAAQRKEGCVALLVIDLDRFKDINDALGHDYGDLLLAQLGPRLRTPLRESDTVARLGGDEFAVLLPQVLDLNAALLVAERIQQSLHLPFDVHGMSLAVEASIGVVVSPEHGDDVRTLFQRADVAMYVAKDNGVGIAAYERSLDDHSPERAALLGDLRRALEENELVLHYQPQSSLETGALSGVEALVRWDHPAYGLLTPERFLPLAERTGLVHALTKYVLNVAMGDCRRWYDTGICLPVAVNLSARTLMDAGFSRDVEQVLSYWGVPAELLVLEITESALMADPARARDLLIDLSALGVQISIDDFGTGYSSLTCLRTLPVDELKIDRSFVTDMLVASNDAFIVRSVVRLGHDLGLRVVAEGIEDEQTRDALAGLGCDVGQGYGLGMPVPPEQLLAQLRRPGTVVQAHGRTPHPAPPGR
jgi:diguanylate cyclase (GGDEF)-like protein